MPTFGSDRDQPYCSEHREVLGDMRLGQSQSVNKVTDGCLPGAKCVKEVPSAGFGDGVESIGRRRSPGHKEIICPYWYVSRREVSQSCRWAGEGSYSQGRTVGTLVHRARD